MKWKNGKGEITLRVSKRKTVFIEGIGKTTLETGENRIVIDKF